MVIEMTSRKTQETERTTMEEAARYIGALTADDRCLTLVPINPEDPWEAFRAMRRAMRRSDEDAKLGLFSSDAPIGHEAKILNFPRKAV